MATPTLQAVCFCYQAAINILFLRRWPTELRVIWPGGRASFRVPDSAGIVPFGLYYCHLQNEFMVCLDSVYAFSDFILGANFRLLGSRGVTCACSFIPCHYTFLEESTKRANERTRRVELESWGQWMILYPVHSLFCYLWRKTSWPSPPSKCPSSGHVRISLRHPVI